MNFDFLPGELERIAAGNAAVTDALLTAAQRIREELAMSSKTKRTKTTIDATVGSTHAQITPPSDLAPTPEQTPVCDSHPELAPADEQSFDLTTVDVVELRKMYSAIGAELKRRAAIERGETPKPANAPKSPRDFGVQCVATGKVLKRTYTDQAQAEKAAAELGVLMKRPYEVVRLAA
jgi:hypothetical protein